MTDTPRLIEVSFPLKQASLDSVHEKNVRHGHISTLHIWPARRPLAASRAALIATLLPDPGTPEERKKLLEKIGGRVVSRTERKKVNGKSIDVKRQETEGGVLHWGREESVDMDWFRAEIRKAYGGRSPRVLDPFAGGGAIPLEAMRLGCEATAIDINPVAWFILKCTLDYPQKLAGKSLPLPKFALESPEFLAEFRKGSTKKTPKKGRTANQTAMFDAPEAELAWHVRAWGWWVLQKAKRDLERFFPVVDDKPTVAYLWARTAKCKNCRATLPLLKTRWLCKKERKRVLVELEPNDSRTGVRFQVKSEIPVVGSNTAQRREHDRRIGQGTMSSTGATCPVCRNAIMTMEDLRLEGQAQNLGMVLFAVVVDGKAGKEYRDPTPEEIRVAAEAGARVDDAFSLLPFGPINEATPGPAGTKNDSCSLRRYGLYEWRRIFNDRQLLSLATFARYTREARVPMTEYGYAEDWQDAIIAFLAAMLDRLANQSTTIAHWNKGGENIEGTFARFALPMVWDFSEVNPLGDTSGGYPSAFEWETLAAAHLCKAALGQPAPSVFCRNAIEGVTGQVDVVVTDPPYYDAIPYSNLMDFFYVWLRRTLFGLSREFDTAFTEPLAPKWDHERGVGELIDDPIRFGKDRTKSKAAYEDGMFSSFRAAHQALTSEGRMVVVFAHKHPDAWETLVSAIIRAGFVVDGSWPIQTERKARTRSFGSSALSSSVWLVCKKRPEAARPGWDTKVLDEMRERIHARLRDFWDADIRGPDFVWAATGPAMEAYSKHPVVKKANEPGQVMAVSEFLRHVRRLVVDFVVGRVLTKSEAPQSVSGLDDATTYYLLHRYDFGFNDAPAGACILYAVSCGLTDHALTDQLDLLAKTGGKTKSGDDADDSGSEESEEGDGDDDQDEGSGSTLRLKSWKDRKRRGMGFDTEGRPAPLIDQAHRLMHLWRAGDAVKVDEYLDARALRRNALFHQLLQALIELNAHDTDERPLLESISNHVFARGALARDQKVLPNLETAP